MRKQKSIQTPSPFEDTGAEETQSGMSNSDCAIICAGVVGAATIVSVVAPIALGVAILAAPFALKGFGLNKN
jgi:hypothetical protein